MLATFTNPKPHRHGFLGSTVAATTLVNSFPTLTMSKRFRRASQQCQLAVAFPSPYIQAQLAKPNIVTIFSISIGGFAGILYMIIVKYLLRQEWFRENFTYTPLFRALDERFDNLENNQKETLRVQKQLLELFKKNKN